MGDDVNSALYEHDAKMRSVLAVPPMLVGRERRVNPLLAALDSAYQAGMIDEASMRRITWDLR